MNMQMKHVLRKSPLIAVGLLMSGLAACDSRPATQASRDVDEIVNRAPSPAAGKEGTVAGADNRGATTQAPDDVALNLKVQDALKSNFTLKALPIIVQTTDGVVTLSGSADSPAHRDQATQVAMGVAGVRSVQNKLTVDGT